MSVFNLQRLFVVSICFVLVSLLSACGSDDSSSSSGSSANRSLIQYRDFVVRAGDLRHIVYNRYEYEWINLNYQAYLPAGETIRYPVVWEQIEGPKVELYTQADGRAAFTTIPIGEPGVTPLLKFRVTVETESGLRAQAISSIMTNFIWTLDKDYYVFAGKDRKFEIGDTLYLIALSDAIQGPIYERWHQTGSGTGLPIIINDEKGIKYATVDTSTLDAEPGSTLEFTYTMQRFNGKYVNDTIKFTVAGTPPETTDTTESTDTTDTTTE